VKSAIKLLQGRSQSNAEANWKRPFAQADPDLVMHLAAESQWMRSTRRTSDSLQQCEQEPVICCKPSEDIGSASVVEQKRTVSDCITSATDEVFGSLGETGSAFSETTPHDPRSPYYRQQGCP